MPTSVITQKSRLPVILGAATAKVTLQLSYGYGQIGGSALERSPGAIAEPGDAFDLGPANQLIGRYIILKSVVADVSDMTNKVNVIYTFKWGQKEEEQMGGPLEVANDGDPAIFLTRFDFLQSL